MQRARLIERNAVAAISAGGLAIMAALVGVSWIILREHLGGGWLAYAIVVAIFLPMAGYVLSLAFVKTYRRRLAHAFLYVGDFREAAGVMFAAITLALFAALIAENSALGAIVLGAGLGPRIAFRHITTDDLRG
jgi:apolipoprotein N-acyltransferase